MKIVLYVAMIAAAYALIYTGVTNQSFASAFAFGSSTNQTKKKKQ